MIIWDRSEETYSEAGGGEGLTLMNIVLPGLGQIRSRGINGRVYRLKFFCNRGEGDVGGHRKCVLRYCRSNTVL